MTTVSISSTLDRHDLGRYVSAQLTTFFPDSSPVDSLLDVIPSALECLSPSIESVKLWQPDRFDHLHSSQYCMFLYWLARNLWLQEGLRCVCNKLFALNKALNGIDLFYEISMPPVFFVGHSVGIVLAKAVYGNYLVLYQGCTVGKNHGHAPHIEDGVILYPHSAVLGCSRIGGQSVLSQGASVIDRAIPAHSLVFRSEGPEPRVRPSRRSYLDTYFRF